MFTVKATQLTAPGAPTMGLFRALLAVVVVLVCSSLVGCREKGGAGSSRNPTIENGSFETADYEGWTLFEDGDPSSGVWAIGNDSTHIETTEMVFDFHDEIDVAVACTGGGLDVESTDGVYVAIQFQTASSDHRMYQDIELPSDVEQIFWDVFYESDVAFDATNQFTAVHLRDPQSDEIVVTLFKTVAGVDPEVQPVTTMSADISAYSGMRVRLDIEHITRNDCITAYWDAFRID